MSDLNTEIKIGADASGVEAGVGKAKRSLKSLGEAAQQAGKDAGAGMGAIGAGGDKSAKDVERATRTMQNSIQRLIAEQKAGAKGSREYWEALANTRGVNTAALRPLLDQLDAAKSATNAAKGAAESWRDSLGKIGPMVAAAFSGAALAGFIGKVVSVQREFDVLNSSLKTVTGSSAAAEREMAWLKDFAKETPFGLAQATQGFVKMKALGLDPTRAALTSFGNTASAMGKDLNQMIEAVADASTGEFERLKEFGIKAKKEGDNVSLTFQGVTTTIRNSAADITKYLEDIGNTSFGGAMEERAKTLDGTIAALGDTWDELFRTVSTNNVGGLIFDSVTLANGALEDATTILRALGGAAQDAGRDTGALSTIQSGIATVFETVAVLGANLKFVLVGIGNEIGGLAAQVAQAAQFNFSGVAAIRQAMVADAEAARKEIDATTARILNARKAQEEYARYATRNASAATDPRRVDLGGSTTRKPVAGVDSKGINAANKELADQAKLIAELNGLTGSFAKEWDTLSAVYKKGEMSLEQLTSAQAALLAKQPAIKAFADEQNKAQQTLAKANLDAAASREKYITSLSTGLDKIQADIAAQIDATARMGLSKTAIADLDAAKLEMLATDLELQAIKALDRNLDQQTYDALKAQAQAYRELGIAKKGGAAKEAALDLEKANAEAAKKAQEDWERASEQINNTLTDALMRGFESGKDFAKNLRDTVVNMFKTMVLRPIISAVVNPIAGAITGAFGMTGAANAATGGAGGANILSTVQTGFSALNGSISSTIGNAFSKFAGSSVGQSLGLSNTTYAAGPMGPVAPGTELTATGQSLGSALGVVGNTLAGYALGSMARSLISGGYSVGKGMDTFQKVGVAVGS
ncbi:MAG TPA: tape measure protein, partial [Caldilinea sp.]|nr:tape measure protein [Caldilinea sp.]